jgi:hypothetical protein
VSVEIWKVELHRNCSPYTGELYYTGEVKASNGGIQMTFSLSDDAARVIRSVAEKDLEKKMRAIYEPGNR